MRGVGRGVARRSVPLRRNGARGCRIRAGGALDPSLRERPRASRLSSAARPPRLPLDVAAVPARSSAGDRSVRAGDVTLTPRRQLLLGTFAFLALRLALTIARTGPVVVAD